MLNRQQSRLKLDCRWVEQQIMAHLKGGLEPDVAEAMRAHLLRCEYCTATVNEARLIDAELYEEARRQQPQLTAARSQHMQHEVYRQLRRAVVWQRTSYVARRFATVLFLALLFAVGIVLVVNPWLGYLAGTEDSTTTAMVGRELTRVLTPTEVAQQALPVQVIVSDVPTTPSKEGKGASVVALSQPQESVAKLIAAAWTGDTAQLSAASLQTRPLSRESVARVWQRLEACGQGLDLTKFHYRSVQFANNFASVYIFYDAQFVGDLKLRLGDDGNWYPSFVNYSSFTALGNVCSQQQ